MTGPGTPTHAAAQSGAESAQPARRSPHSNSYRNYVLLMLLSLSALNFIDRQILAILLEPIRAEFDLTDTQLGFLGFSFALRYTIMGIPLARLADRGSRRNLITCVVTLWSAMTALCAGAVGFVSLMLARIGVAVGEAGYFPAASSLVSDYFEPARRATALAIVGLGVYIGILFGFLLGGWINELFGWRRAFLVVGLPGVLFAGLFWLTVSEPARGATDGITRADEPPRLGATVKFLWSNRAYRHLSLAAGFCSFVAYGSMTWAPSYFIRTYGMSTAEIGTWLALTIGIAGGVGCFLGGALCDRLATTGDRRWYAWLPAGFALLAMPFILGMYLWPDPRTALLISAGAWFLGNAWLGPILAAVQGAAEPRMRALAVAMMMFVNSVFGLGLGPQVVGILSDAFADVAGANSLRYALIVSLLTASLLAALHFLLASRSLRADLTRLGAGDDLAVPSTPR